MEVRAANQWDHDSAALVRTLHAERPRLVRWCARLTGNLDIAEDLAQETLSAAWRSTRRPPRAEEYPAWLAGIARNMCRSWRRSQQREAARRVGLHLLDDQDAPNPALDLPDDFDLELVLERDELADLLDRALALLPADTRQALIAKYIEASSLAEVASQLGLTISATAARLHRGKLALRRAITTDLRLEAASYGLVLPSGSGWHETRIWCPDCGLHRFAGRLDADTGTLALRCPRCYEQSHVSFAQWHETALFKGLKSYRVALSRLSAKGSSYYHEGLRTGTAACARCGGVADVRRARPDELPESLRHTPCVLVSCRGCPSSLVASLRGLALCHAETQRFWRAHPHLHTLPDQSIETEGRPAVLTRFASKGDTAQLDVITDPTTFAVLRIGGLETRPSSLA